MKFVKLIIVSILMVSIVSISQAEGISTYADLNSYRVRTYLEEDGTAYVCVLTTHIAETISVNSCVLQCYDGGSWHTVCSISMPGTIENSMKYVNTSNCAAACEAGNTYRITVSFLIDGNKTNTYSSASTTF